MDNQAGWNRLEKMPVWGTMNTKTFNFVSNGNPLKTRKAIKVAFDSGQVVEYKKIFKKIKKENLLKGSHLLVCSCGQKVKADANSSGVVCARCTAKAAIKAGGFLHRGMAAMYYQPPKEKKEKKMAETKSTETKSERSNHMSVEAIRARFDGETDRKRGYWQKVFSTLRQMKTVKVQDLAAKVVTYKSTPEKYRDPEKMANQIRWYAKNIWGSRTQLAKMDGDSLTYIPEADRKTETPKS